MGIIRTLVGSVPSSFTCPPRSDYPGVFSGWGLDRAVCCRSEGGEVDVTPRVKNGDPVGEWEVPLNPCRDWSDPGVSEGRRGGVQTGTGVSGVGVDGGPVLGTQTRSPRGRGLRRGYSESTTKGGRVVVGDGASQTGVSAPGRRSPTVRGPCGRGPRRRRTDQEGPVGPWESPLPLDTGPSLEFVDKVHRPGVAPGVWSEFVLRTYGHQNRVGCPV